jgi:hypothetical protein
MPKTADRVLETSTTSGTGTLTLAGAKSGFVTFTSSFAIGEPFWYCVEDGSDFEIGVGQLATSTTMTRLSVIRSSNANALVSFSSNAKDVFCTLPNNSRRAANYQTYLSGVI